MSETNEPRGGGVILVTILLALVLTVIPLPAAVEELRPAWAMMVLIYWALALPHRISLGVAWLMGLVLDVLLGSTLGLRALSMAFVIYVIALQYQKIRNYSLWHQSLIVMILIGAQMWVVMTLEILLADRPLPRNYFWPVLSSGLLWPWVFLMLRKVRRDFNVY